MSSAGDGPYAPCPIEGCDAEIRCNNLAVEFGLLATHIHIHYQRLEQEYCRLKQATA